MQIYKIVLIFKGLDLIYLFKIEKLISKKKSCFKIPSVFLSPQVYKLKISNNPHI